MTAPHEMINASANKSNHGIHFGQTNRMPRSKGVAAQKTKKAVSLRN